MDFCQALIKITNTSQHDQQQNLSVYHIAEVSTEPNSQLES